MTDAIRCPGCNQLVEAEFYKMHVDGDTQNRPHKLKTITIAGMGGPELVQHNPRGPVMLDIPYLGRVRRDAFLAWSFLMLLLGILMEANLQAHLH